MRKVTTLCKNNNLQEIKIETLVYSELILFNFTIDYLEYIPTFEGSYKTASSSV